MSLTKIPSSGLTGNITLGNVVISGSITDSAGTVFVAGGGGGSGSVGYTGSQGAAGTNGTIGVDGYTGSQGAAGYTGSQGIQGGTGYAGSRGDTGLGFTIAKTYASIAALTADTAPAGIVAGEFALVETGNVEDADNSKLYLWSGTAYTYVTDLSGAAGITGPSGTAGYTGSVGNTGNDGAVGYTGSTGTGFTGSAGANGADGATGPQGIQGLVGYTGSAGSGGGGGGSTGYTGSAGTVAIQEFVATEGQDTFTVASGYVVDTALVFVNGIQMNNNDYTAANGTTVVLTEARRSGDIVRVLSNMVSPSININNIKTFSVAMSVAMGM